MPSHLREKLKSGEIANLPDGVTDFDVTANDHADDLAGKAAAACELPDATTTPYLSQVQRVKHIQKRLTTIAMYLPAREKKHEATKPPVVPRPNRVALLASSSHSIITNGSRYTCTVCKSSFSSSDPGCNHWLSTQCLAPMLSPQEHVPARFEGPVHIGNRISHFSHDLYSYRGIIYCNTCGARSGINQIRNLGSQCEPSGSGGQAVLRAIELEKNPPGGTEWPI